MSGLRALSGTLRALFRTEPHRTQGEMSEPSNRLLMARVSITYKELSEINKKTGSPKDTMVKACSRNFTDRIPRKPNLKTG